MRNSRSALQVFFGSLIALVVVALIPVSINLAFSPLRPPALIETATIYHITEEFYLTREARDQIEATSVFEVIPLEEETSTPDSQLESLATNSTITVAQVTTSIPPTPQPIQASSSLELAVYSCPFPDELIDGETIPANQSFLVRGWNLDADEQTYFLIEDDPAKEQKWVLVDASVVLQTPDFKTIFPRATGCRTWVVAAQQPTSDVAVGTDPTATIPLPQIRTATPLPPEPVRLELDNEEASTQVAEDVPELKNPSVSFSPNGVTVIGSVEADGPLGIKVGGTLILVGELAIVENKLVMDVTSAKVNGGDITNEESGIQAENAINNWLRQLLVRRDVQAFELSDGAIVIDVLERSESLLPTLAVSATPTVDPDSTTPDPNSTPGGEATPALPRAIEVTFTPDFARASDLTSSQATVLADGLTLIQRANISFNAASLHITGEVQRPGQSVLSPVEVVGQLEVRDEYLALVVTTLTVDGTDERETDFGRSLIEDVNNWLPLLSNHKRVQGFELGNGILKINP